MTIASALGLSPTKKVRYGIIGLGDIAQEAMLPGVAHTGNSEITALVTNDSEKARKLGEHYGVSNICDYDGYEELLSSGKVDAVYIAMPNWRHAEFAVPALKAGIHTLIEKPLEVSSERCLEIIDAQRGTGAKLMVAYRLHFEPATLATIDLIRSGRLGETSYLNVTFVQPMDPGNQRAQSGVKAGPIFDMGPYPVNAARMVFEAEPEEVVSAVGLRHPEAGFGDDFDHTVAVVLRFPGNRLAQILMSYHGNAVDALTVIGTRGNVRLDPCFLYGASLEQFVTIGEDKSHETFRNTDHFGGEMKYFSDCILGGKDPEPDGEEGYADVRVFEAIVEALGTGKPVKLEPFERTRHIDTAAQRETLRAVKSPELVNAANPLAGKEKVPKN